MFGSDFFPNDATTYNPPPRQGVGKSGIASYVSYTTTIPSQKDTDSNSKVGVTLSRIPIGVYVRMVDIESEAYCAGVVPGSVLIDINGMGVLGEPSHKLLERLWMYEGHFAELGTAVQMKNHHHHHENASILVGKDKNEIQKGLTGPVALKLINDGIVYTVVLVTGAPFGISWAPAGNFALVQRTYGHAQKAGVKRGCIVAAVNDKSLREMNHLDTAMELKDQFNKGNDIRIVCVYTPAASRTSHHEQKKLVGGKSKSSLPNEIKTIDGVRIRRVNPLKRMKDEKPTEYGAGTFFSCGAGPNYVPMTEDEANNDLISEIANRIAAGEAVAPTGMKRGLSSIGRKSQMTKTSSFVDMLNDKVMTQQMGITSSDRRLLLSIYESQNKYMNCPLLSWTDVLDKWNYLDNLAFSVRMQAAAYSMETFSNMGGVIGCNTDKKSNAAFSKSLSLHSTGANFNFIKSIVEMKNCAEVIRQNLLPMVAFASSKVLLAENVFINDDNKTVDDPESRVLAEMDSICGEMIEFLVDMAMCDDNVCQALHFLLRAFTDTYSKSGKDEPSLLSPVKILISAHSLLRNRLVQKNVYDQPSTLVTKSTKISPINQFDSSSVASFADRNNTFQENSNRKGISKKLSKMFSFKKKSKASSDMSGSWSADHSFSNSASTDAEAMPVITNKTKSPFRPTPILRKAADQSPQIRRNSRIPGVHSTAVLFENMGRFLNHLDSVAEIIERVLMKSFSKKITDWALQPWNDSKKDAFGECTSDFRDALKKLGEKKIGIKSKSDHNWSPVLNPIDSNELLLSIIPEESYILPSAHFPLLLTFDSCPRHVSSTVPKKENSIFYTTKISMVALRGDSSTNDSRSYIVHACVGGKIKETGKSSIDPYYGSYTHRWNEADTLTFDSSRLWCRPCTIELRISSVDTGNDELREVGFAFVDISNIWNQSSVKKFNYSSKVLSFTKQASFGQDGSLIDDLVPTKENLTIEISVVGETIPLLHGSTDKNTGLVQKSMLLYKHDEDMRQEMLAIEFIATCDRILKASGLDLKIKTYGCIPVGHNKGFIEWVPGALSLSELCKPNQSNGEDSNSKYLSGDLNSSSDGLDVPSSAFQRHGSWCTYESLRSLRQHSRSSKQHGIGISGDNPLQEFLRSNAYDASAPYLIKKDVMDTFVKSCAGYCVITYLLGVGDRHTDNLLLHSQGYFFHCDYSFILGQDPKTYLPMRITSQMIDTMGGKESDNFAKFLSLVGAAFVTLRQPSSVRVLISLLKGMVDAKIPDISINQKPESALQLFHERLCLNLNDNDAVLFLEENIARSSTSKIWVAVDALHSLGKRF